MKIYISADIEGITGATHWDETYKKADDFKAFREQMTAEVGAACSSALESGASEIWVKDAHDTGRNVIASKLPKEIRLIRGWSGHPNMMVQEIDESFGAVMLIGYHSRAGANTSPLAHTMTGKASHIKINEKFASELLLQTYAAALVNVPLILVSGDEGICSEAKEIVPNVVAVPVMRGVGCSTISIHPQLAVEKISEAVKLALDSDPSHCQIELPKSFSVEIRYKEHFDTFRAAFFPGVKQETSHSIRFDTSDYFEVMRLLSFVL